MDSDKFARIFGHHRGRPGDAARLVFEDADFIADMKARISGHAARDNQTRNSGWLIDFSPVRTDDLTERSMFDAVLTSASEGERRLPITVSRNWVEIGGGAMESSVRSSADNVEQALANAFRRVVLRRTDGAAVPGRV